MRKVGQRHTEAPRVTLAPKPIRRRGLHRDVVDELGQRIVRGDYQPGTALPSEAELGENLEVSRTVVREAIKVLAAKGLVDPRPKTGTRVLERAQWSLIDPDVLSWQVDLRADAALFRDLSEVRGIIEPHAAALAAMRRTDVEAERLRDLMHELDGVADDLDRYIAVDLELHAAILRATHNELLARMTGTIRVALDASRRITVKAPGGPRSAMARHRNVIEAIHDRDGATAQRAMATLVRGTALDLEAVLGPVPL
jgi:DNA-binding FadR family transcriptional regulator